MSAEPKFINVTMSSIVKDHSMVTMLDIESIIDNVCNEYGINHTDKISYTRNDDNIEVTFSVYLDQDADTIGACIEEIKRKFYKHLRRKIK